MSDSRFVYVTYIRTTPEKLWQALFDPEFTRRYFYETWQESEWKQGASWQMMHPDGRALNTGKVLEIEPHRRLVLSWRHERPPELREEGFSALTRASGDKFFQGASHDEHDQQRHCPAQAALDATRQARPDP